MSSRARRIGRIAIALVLLGATIWIARRFVNPERLDAVDAYVAERGVGAAFLVVLSLRLFAHMAFDVVSYASGLVRFPFRWFVPATALGEIPKVFLFTSLGAGLGGSSGWLGVGIAAGAVVTLALFG